MAKRPMPPAETLRQVLRYEADTGKLFWKLRTPEMFEATQGRSAAHICALWNSRYAGREALASPFEGYLYGKLLGHTELAHRVIWTLVYGEQPAGEIDHINHCRSDNRLQNMRVVSDQDNAKNQSLRECNTSGTCGVSWHRAAGKWAAYIADGHKVRHLGVFVDINDAIAARKAAEIKFNFHPNHGKAAA